MFTPANHRAAAAYKRVGADTIVHQADPHRLVNLLFDELLQSIANARGAMARQQVAAKGACIGRAVSILEEGLKASLNQPRGGEIAANLHDLYDYCIMQLTRANALNSDAMLLEVRTLIEKVADAWRQIGPMADAAAAPRTRLDA